LTVVDFVRNLLAQLILSAIQRLEERFKRWTKPGHEKLVSGTALDLTRSKRELVAENAFLRQQLIVLKRQTGRAQPTQKDRWRLVLLARLARGWKEALIAVKPDTLLKWHRQGFRLFWRRKSKPESRQPRIPAEAIALIGEMAVANRLWGAKRIRDELRKVGYRVSKRTVAKYMRQARRGLPPRQASQTWATFLANHAHEIWACDFLQTYDLFFRPIFLFFLIELGSRRAVHFGVTRSPSDAWTAQQLREATPFGEGPRFLLRDNDDKYGPQFARVAKGTNMDVLRTPVRAPKANAICERFLGSVRRECLDHMLVLSERHLQRIITAYVGYFNDARPHQGIGQRIPGSLGNDAEIGHNEGRVVAFPVLGGLHHDYRRAA
jgi:transposase InsO family protein